MIGCIEEVAFLHKFISKKQFLDAIELYGKSKYGEYLKNFINL